jgi:hypothetical protein
MPTIKSQLLTTFLKTNKNNECIIETETEDELNENEIYITRCRGLSSQFPQTDLYSLGDMVDFIIYHLQPNFLLIRQLQYINQCLPSAAIHESKYYSTKLLEISLETNQTSQKYYCIKNQTNSIDLILKKSQSQSHSEEQSESWFLDYTNREGHKSSIELESYPKDFSEKKDNLYLECGWSTDKGSDLLLIPHPVTSKNMKIIFFLLKLNIPTNKD